MSYLSIILVAGAIILLRRWRLWYRNQVLPDLNTKRVMITGTDSGFGHQLALDLDKLGLIVYAGCYTDQGAKRLNSEASSRLKVFKLDVTDPTSITSAREFVSKDLPNGQGLWGLVNNAGVAQGALVFEFSQMADYRQAMEVNFFGVVAMTEAFLPLLKKAKGRIVNVISIMGRSSLVAGPYCSSKFALEPYSAGLRRATKPFGVKVSIIEPGFFPTGMCDPNGWCRDIDSTWQRLPEDLKKEYGETYKDGVKQDLKNFAIKPPLSGGNKIIDVTDSISHALIAKHPRYRYVVGLDSYLIYVPLSYLPECVLDFFIRMRLRKVHIASLKQ